MNGQALAILWAQWRTTRNFLLRANNSGIVFTAIVTTLWYTACVAGAAAIAIVMASPTNKALVDNTISPGLFLVFLYWQVFPVLMASSGAFLDIRRLMVYPIAHAQLFRLETMLRVSVAVEAILLVAGAVVGLLLNPEARIWAPAALVIFVLFNLFLSTGMKQVLGRLWERKHVRELLVIGLVLAGTLPQALLLLGPPKVLIRFFHSPPEFLALLPWKLTASIVLGKAGIGVWAALAGWTAMAYAFGRWQFNVSLRFDIEAARADARPASKVTPGWTDSLFRLPTRFLPDPIGAIVEMELRFLSRAPRFRLILLMGCVLGQVLWLPQALGRHASSTSAVSSNYLTFCAMYSLLILGDNLFWNSFGFDRGAAQMYFVTPVKFSRVLMAKNIVAAVIVTLQLCFVTAVSLLLRLPVSALKIVEAFAVVYTYSIFLMAIGNIGSVYQARAVNPAQAWKNSATAKLQTSLLLVYPMLSLPLLLAYGARYAFESEAAFYGVLLVDILVAAGVYWVAMDSAVEAAETNKERMLAALAQGDGPVVSS
jgi:ABC-2 type transport system permease protein